MPSPCAASNSRAAVPLAASYTAKPCCTSICAVTVRTVGSSSTTRILPLMVAVDCGVVTRVATTPLLAHSGNTIRIVVPTFTTLSALICPPACSIVENAVGNPSPLPCPMPLVVKKGSKIRGSTPAGIPSPVSSTRISMAWSDVRDAPLAVAWTSKPRGRAMRRVLTVSRPPSGIASRALRRRINSTSSSRAISTGTHPTAGSSSTDVTTDAPSRCRIPGSRPAILSFGFDCPSDAELRREK